MPANGGWLSTAKYEHLPILGCTGPGTMIDDSAWKFIGHTTESDPGTIDAVRSLFEGKPCYTPQFTIDPAATQRRMQHIPWTWSGAALAPGCNGMETNRWRSVQAEICDRSVNSPNWDDSVLWQIGDLLADLILDGCPINLDEVPDYESMTGTTATASAPQRMNGAVFQWFGGVGAHIIVGCNDHYDWHRARAWRMAQFAKEILAGGSYVITEPVQPPPPSYPPPTVTSPGVIMIGMQGGIVEFAQQLLIGLGYTVGPDGADGIFGQGTEAGVKAFQREHGLDPDGIIGPLTAAAIAQAYGNGPGIPTGDYAPWPGRYLVVQSPFLTGADVWAVQTKCAQLGYDIGPAGVDTVYGNDSANAVYNFQVDHGLLADRVVGPDTWNAMAAIAV